MIWAGTIWFPTLLSLSSITLPLPLSPAKVWRRLGPLECVPRVACPGAEYITMLRKILVLLHHFDTSCEKSKIIKSLEQNWIPTKWNNKKLVIFFCRDISSPEAIFFFLPFTSILYLLGHAGMEVKYVAGKEDNDPPDSSDSSTPQGFILFLRARTMDFGKFNENMQPTEFTSVIWIRIHTDLHYRRPPGSPSRR